MFEAIEKNQKNSVFEFKLLYTFANLNGIFAKISMADFRLSFLGCVGIRRISKGSIPV